MGDDYNTLTDMFFEELFPEDGSSFEQYAGRPEAFFEEVLGVKVLTYDQRRFLRSVAANIVTVSQAATGVGKTYIMAGVMLYFYLCYVEVEVWATAAPPESNLKTLLWGELNRHVRAHPDLFTDSNVTNLSIERVEKQHIKGVRIPTTGTPEEREARMSGKHQSVLIFVVDEGDAVPDEVYKAIDGCMSGGKLVRLIVSFNPRRRAGAIYRKIRDRRAKVVSMSALDHPNVRTGDDIVPGAVTRDATVRRIWTWTDPAPDYEPPDDWAEVEDDGHQDYPTGYFCIPVWLDGYQAPSEAGDLMPPLEGGQWRKIIKPEFSYKVLGVYPAADSSQLIPQDKIDEAVTRWQMWVAQYGERPPEGVAPIAGLDVAEMGVDNNVYTLRYAHFVPRQKKWQGIDLEATAKRAAAEGNKLDIIPQRINIDAIGIGAGVPKDVRRHGGQRVCPVVVSKKSRPKGSIRFRMLRDELYWEMREWFMSDDAMIPPDKNLIEQLAIPTYEEVGANVVIMRKKDMKKMLGGKSPDEMESLMLTFKKADFVSGGI